MKRKILIDIEKLLASQEIKLIEEDMDLKPNEARYNFTNDNSLQLKLQKNEFHIVHSLLLRRNYKITGTAKYSSRHYIWLDF